MNEEEIKDKLTKKLLKKSNPFEDVIIKEVKKAVIERDNKVEEKRKAEQKETNELLKKVISEIEEKKIRTIIDEIRKIKFEVPEIEAPEIPKELIAEMKKDKIDYDKIVVPIIKELSRQKELRISEVKNPLPISEIEEKTYETLSEILNKDFPTILQIRNKEGKVINPATEETLKTFVKRIIVRGGGRGIDKTEMKGALDEEKATASTIYNKAMPTKDTEYSQVLPTGTKKIKIKLRDYNKMKFSFTENHSGSNYITIPHGATYPEENIYLSGKTLYFQSPADSQTCEIICWT